MIEEHLPGNGRLYIFAAERSLAGSAETLLSQVDRFLAGWKSHGSSITAARSWRYDRFLLIGVDESGTGLSGCSIDGMIRHIKMLEESLGVKLIDPTAVYYRDGDEIRRVSRNEFTELARSGKIGPGTIVFNNTIQTVAQLRQGLWEVPAEKSWHARLLRIAAPVPD